MTADLDSDERVVEEGVGEEGVVEEGLVEESAAEKGVVEEGVEKVDKETGDNKSKEHFDSREKGKVFEKYEFKLGGEWRRGRVERHRRK